MSTNITLSLFTPAEAEKITGVSTSLQRDWRRRKFLGSHEGHARFNVFDLAEMAYLQMMSARGIGPEYAQVAQQFVGLGAAYCTLLSSQAYEGDHHLTLSWNSAFASGGVREKDWETKGEFLAHYLVRRQFGPAVPAPYFIWWANGDHHFDYSLEKAFSPENPKLKIERLIGPAIVIDLEALGAILLSKTDRPFVHIEYETKDGRAIAPDPAKAPGEK